MIPYSIASYDLIVDVLADIDFLESSHAAYLKDKYLNYPFDYDSFCEMNTRKITLIFYASSHDFYIVQLFLLIFFHYKNERSCTIHEN